MFSVNITSWIKISCQHMEWVVLLSWHRWILICCGIGCSQNTLNNFLCIELSTYCTLWLPIFIIKISFVHCCGDFRWAISRTNSWTFTWIAYIMRWFVTKLNWFAKWIIAWTIKLNINFNLKWKVPNESKFIAEQIVVFTLFSMSLDLYGGVFKAMAYWWCTSASENLPQSSHNTFSYSSAS